MSRTPAGRGAARPVGERAVGAPAQREAPERRLVPRGSPACPQTESGAAGRSPREGPCPQKPPVTRAHGLARAAGERCYRGDPAPPRRATGRPGRSPRAPRRRGPPGAERHPRGPRPSRWPAPPCPRLTLPQQQDPHVPLHGGAAAPGAAAASPPSSPLPVTPASGGAERPGQSGAPWRVGAAPSTPRLPGFTFPCFINKTKQQTGP